MTTPLHKPIRRRSNENVRCAGKPRALVVSLYPNGLIGIRPAGTRREETTSIEATYHRAIKERVLREATERKAARKKG